MDHFWSKVEKGPNCWLWLARHDQDGYGRFLFEGRNVGAHRVAWILTHGEIPSHLEIDHLCRVRNCVNPAHMELVSHRVNMLRGTSMGAINKAKTHCVAGHLFDEANTRYRREGRSRECRACRRERRRRYKLRRKAVAVPQKTRPTPTAATR